MKKILPSLLIFILINFDIYAESYSIPLTYDVSPTYTLSFPKYVDVSENETSFNFSVSGDIYYDYLLEVTFDNSTTITNDKYTATINVTQDKSEFNYNDLLNTSVGTVYLSHNTLSSGTWHGELNISINLKEGTTDE